MVQERYVYDAFGNVNGLASDWNRTFTGQVLDAETGLMLYRNRFYSTELGRFLQRDPIGYDAGDMNLVRYVGNGVVDMVDSIGLQYRPGPYGGGYPIPYDQTPTCGSCPPQQHSWPIIMKYLGRCFLSGPLRNKLIGGNKPIPNIFNHPFIRDKMKAMTKNLEGKMCGDEGGKDSYSDKIEASLNSGANPHPKGTLGIEWLINNFRLSYEATSKPAVKEGCYDVEITWKFSDPIDAKTFEDLAQDAGGRTPWIDYPEGIMRNCIQEPMAAGFTVDTPRKESMTICCCEK